MAIESRRGCFYHYAARREGRRVVKEYLGPLNDWQAELVRRETANDRDRRRMARTEAAEVESEAVAVLAALDGFDRLADRVFRAVMHLAGHHCHHRCEWRRTRGVIPMVTLDALIEAYGPKTPAPALIKPFTQNREHQKILDRAAKGDESVLPAVRELLEDPALVSSFGAVAWMAEAALIGQAAGDDIAVQEAVMMKMRDHNRELLADDPRPAPYPLRMAATRVTHCWLAVHVLEAMAARYKIGSAGALAVERQLASAERRLALALKSLAVLRKLNRPTLLAQVNVANGPMLVDNRGRC